MISACFLSAIPSIFSIALSLATALLMATRFELRPDDVIFVAEQPVTRWNRVIDQISPSLIAVPLDNATTN